MGLRYVARPEELGRPDLVILPGTKSTLHDLRWLRQSGLEAAIQKLAAGGTPVIGICGGYQMLGESLSDPEGAEGGGRMAGMGLLPVSTVFRRDKTRTQTAGSFPACQGFFAPLSGAPLEGYEIHMGTGGGLFSIRDRVLGTYLHGLFDSARAAPEAGRPAAEGEGAAGGRGGGSRRTFGPISSGSTTSWPPRCGRAWICRPSTAFWTGDWRKGALPDDLSLCER